MVGERERATAGTRMRARGQAPRLHFTVSAPPVGVCFSHPLRDGETTERAESAGPVHSGDSSALLRHQSRREQPFFCFLLHAEPTLVFFFQLDPTTCRKSGHFWVEHQSRRRSAGFEFRRRRATETEDGSRCALTQIARRHSNCKQDAHIWTAAAAGNNRCLSPATSFKINGISSASAGDGAASSLPLARN